MRPLLIALGIVLGMISVGWYVMTILALALAAVVTEWR